MKRITPDEVVEAFYRTGLKPEQGDLFPREGCACGLGAYAKMHGCESSYDSLEFLNGITSRNYVNSFGYGFDGENLPNYPIYNNDIAEMGYEDGKNAWEAVKHLVGQSK